MRFFGRQRWPLIMLLVAGGLGTLALTNAFNRPEPPPEAPVELPPSKVRLAVLVVFDQMRGDYLQRWDDLFGDDGFHRLETEGAWFQNCHYPYALTVTGAGHASILTGCSPDRHGIVSNDWYENGGSVNCVGSERYHLVPRGGKARAAAPDRLVAQTLADVLKDATGGRSRVIGLSIKDRSAVLPAGHKPDGAYWFDAATGQFVTSSFYRDQPHAWVAAFNRAKKADRWRDAEWNRLGTFDYVARSGPDEVKGEGSGVIVRDEKSGAVLVQQGGTFPHPMPAARYYDALDTTPFGNELLLDLAKSAIDAEQLGQREAPDLLTISFSSNDYIGHVWGPDSQEVLDVTLRSDLIIRDLLAHLDARVGRGNYALALTADHGVCPLPEVSRREGRDAQRRSASDLVEEAEKFLDQKFGSGTRPGGWFEPSTRAAGYLPWLYLNKAYLQQRKLPASQIETALVEWFKEQPGIETAYSRTQLLTGVPADDAISQRVRRSFYPSRSGDVAVIQKPYYLYAENVFLATGTTHGTPYPYDTHVPLLAMGPGIPGGPQTEPVTPQAAAAILAQALGIAPPRQAEATLPNCLVGK